MTRPRSAASLSHVDTFSNSFWLSSALDSSDWSSERCPYRELERARGLEGVAIEVPRVDEAERHVHDRHHHAHLDAARGAQFAEVEGIALRVGLAGVVEHERAHHAGDVEVVLRVEQHELVAAERAPLRIERADRADVDAADLRFAAEEEAAVV